MYVLAAQPLLGAGGCRWESSVCQVCHLDDTIQWQIADFRQISPWNACRENEIGWHRELGRVSDLIPLIRTPHPSPPPTPPRGMFILSPELVVITLLFFY